MRAVRSKQENEENSNTKNFFSQSKTIEGCCYLNDKSLYENLLTYIYWCHFLVIIVLEFRIEFFFMN